MGRLALLVATVVLGAVSVRVPLPAVEAQASRCVGLRQDVVTLTDPNAGDIDETQIIGVRVSALAGFPVPDQLPEHSRFNPYETTVYRTAGQLVQAQLGPNQEIDLVIADPDLGRTITIIFPDAARCGQGADPALLQLMQQARQQFIAALGMPSAGGYTSLSGQAVVTGIGFVDQSSDNEGQAGIELAPVLDFQFVPAAAPGP